jgi:hypothetical protein
MRIARPERLLFALVLGACGAAGAADLGTLFNTPQERARLDRLRRGEPLEHTGTVAGVREVTGYVKRSDGRSTVFIDGVPMPVTNARAGTLLEPEALRDRGDVKVERRKPK